MNIEILYDDDGYVEFRDTIYGNWLFDIESTGLYCVKFIGSDLMVDLDKYGRLLITGVDDL